MQVFASLLTKPEVISALVKVRGEVVRMTDKKIFMLHYAKPARLAEFQQAQWQAADSIRNYLRDVWLSQLQKAVVTNLERVGKGWFNIHETNHQTYMYSKLRKLLNMVRAMCPGAQGLRYRRLVAMLFHTAYLTMRAAAPCATLKLHSAEMYLWDGTAVPA